MWDPPFRWRLSLEKESLASVPNEHSPATSRRRKTRLRRARNTVRLKPPMSASMEACIARHAAVLTPSLLVPSPLLPLPSPLTSSPTDVGAPLGYKATMIRYSRNEGK
nr:hypothetical protein [Tanacetum cinerariifolium]